MNKTYLIVIEGNNTNGLPAPFLATLGNIHHKLEEREKKRAKSTRWRRILFYLWDAEKSEAVHIGIEEHKRLRLYINGSPPSNSSTYIQTLEK